MRWEHTELQTIQHSLFQTSVNISASPTEKTDCANGEMTDEENNVIYCIILRSPGSVCWEGLRNWLHWLPGPRHTLYVLVLCSSWPRLNLPCLISAWSQVLSLRRIPLTDCKHRSVASRLLNLYGCVHSNSVVNATRCLRDRFLLLHLMQLPHADICEGVKL